MNNIFLLNDYITNGFRVEYVDIIYLFSIFLGVLTITSRNPVISVLFLIGLFFNIAALLVFVGYNFIGLAYILVYVGAVSILFLFILMLINIRISELLNENSNAIPLSVLVVLVFYNIISKVLPLNLLDSTIVTRICNSFTELNNIQINNEIFNIVDLQKQLGTASSVSWDTSLIEPTHITSIGNIMYTSYSMWLIVTSIILLLGMVGAIVITIKQK